MGDDSILVELRVCRWLWLRLRDGDRRTPSRLAARMRSNISPERYPGQSQPPCEDLTGMLARID
jgi:hypothetical protein